MVAAKPNVKIPEIDMSLENWIYNTRSILHFPVTILTVLALLVAGTFVEIVPRKSLEVFDSTLGRIVFFIVPIFLAYSIDWPTGVLAAMVSLIVFSKLQKSEIDEGFTNSVDSDTGDISTKIISSPHRWFVEKILGESPLAISSDRIRTSRDQDETQRTSSSLSSTGVSSGSSGSTSSTEDQLSLSTSSSNK